MARERGKVAKFAVEKGWGFITRANGTDVFAHYSEIQEPGFRKLDVGETVEFEISEGPKGLHAVSIIRLGL
jgi:CspA family cold shock protein